MIELAGVRLERPRAAAPLLASVDLNINRGDVVLVTGGAGAGTSTLISALIGDVTPAEGKVSLFGRDLARLRRSSLLSLRRRLGVIPQDLQLLPECTALANVELPLEIDHVPRRDANARAAAALTRLGLGDATRAPVHELSHAERQRVAVARALVRAPAVLLADQPTALQDADGADLIAAALHEAAALGAAVLVTGRDPHLVAAASRYGWIQLMVHRGHLVDVTQLVSLEPEITIEHDVPDDIVLETTQVEPELELAPVIELAAVARARGAR